MYRDFGSKPGGGQMMSGSAANADRIRRVAELGETASAAELEGDPYILKNHLGTYECRLCMTLHPSQSNYLSHTLGKKHQNALRRRAARNQQLNGIGGGDRQVPAAQRTHTAPVKFIKIGRPGYTLTHQYDPITSQRGILIQVFYPDIDRGIQPRHRFVNAYEQHIERVDANYQYLLFAARPYETVAFKIPNVPLDNDILSNKNVYSDWDEEQKIFSLQLQFRKEEKKWLRFSERVVLMLGRPTLSATPLILSRIIPSYNIRCLGDMPFGQEGQTAETEETTKNTNPRFEFHDYVKPLDDQWVEQDVIRIGRHFKAMKGGRQMSFSGLVLLGNGKGTAGFGYGKAEKVADAVRNAFIDAEKNLVHIDMYEGERILRSWEYRYKGTRVYVGALPKGAGFKGGPLAKQLSRCFGFTDCSIKIRGPKSKNLKSKLHCLFEALRRQPNPKAQALAQGRQLFDVNKIWRRRDLSKVY